MFCIRCGQKIEDDSIFCEFCGAKQPEKPAVPQFHVPEQTVEETVDVQAVEAAAVVEPFVTEEAAEIVEKTEVVEPVEITENIEPAGTAENIEAPKEEETFQPVQQPYNEPVIERFEPKKKSKGKKIAIIAGIAVAVIAIAAGLLSINSDERKLYREAKSLMADEQYYAAENLFSFLGDFRDSEERFNECFNKARYNEAKELIANGDTESVEEAEELLGLIAGYEGSEALIEECKNIKIYNQAVQNMEDMYFEQAEKLFESISDYSDSAEMAEKCKLFEQYHYAHSLYQAKNYEAAKAEYEALGDFEDSKDFVDLCEKGMKYEEAMELYEAESYDEAKVLFDEISGYEDADKYSTWCDCIPKYAEGLELFNKEKYKESLEYLKDCADADYLDSKELYDKADKYQYYEEDYQAALKLYNAGKYYSAKVAFEKLGDYKDSAKKAESCVRSKPSSGEIYHNSSYKSSSVSLKITAPSSTSTFLKIYCSGDLVSTVFIRAGGSATVYLPSGTYTIDADYGSTWYGTAESFGPNGSYCTLLNGSTTNFSLSSGSWSLQLLASTTGNVGSKSRSWGS